LPAQVSVIISTFNRCDELSGTLETLLVQQTDGADYEVIVVDNNSTDRTRETVASFVARGQDRFRYVFEPRQGVSHGRNAGIAIARAPVIAFTDDDVLVAPDWVNNIRKAFEANPGIDYVTGKMLPIYDVPPPAWLTQDNTGPCVLRDRGDTPAYSTPGCFFPGWATANIAFRRDVFERIGGFSGDFPRGQDLELIVRLWRANGRGMYAPDVVVRHHIPVERMTKAYHRMWHAREGDIRSRIGYREIFDADGRIMRDPPRSPTLFRVPAFIYRDLMLETVRWLAAAATRDEGLTFLRECRLRQTLGYVRTRFREYRRERERTHAFEIGAFTKELIVRKWRGRTVGVARTANGRGKA
jgi:glucosyl-dolichyl phosphate glucuronosyltransferase